MIKVGYYAENPHAADGGLLESYYAMERAGE